MEIESKVLPHENFIIDKDFLIVRWKYTTLCNMNCSYCNLDNTKQVKIDYNKIIRDKILQQSKKYKDINFYIDIEGGEPTLDLTVFDLVSNNNVFYKLYTNFKKPNIDKLNEFSKHSKVELSLNSDLVNYKYFQNLKLLNINSNIYVSVLTTIKTPVFQLEFIISKLKKLNINFGISEAEDFTNLKITETNTSYFKSYSRLKFNFYNYKCYCKQINVDQDNLFVTNCSNSYKKLITSFDTQDYINNTQICKSKICGVHDGQTLYKKEKL